MLPSGTQDRAIRETTISAGSKAYDGSVMTDSLLATLWVDSVSSGNLTVEVFTLTDDGKQLLLFAFPVVSSGTVNLLLKKAAVTLQRFRVVATYTGACQYEVYVRAVNGAGEASVKIVGAATLETSATPITASPGVLIASTLTDRNGLIIKNYTGSGTLFVSEDIAKLPAQAWPISPGETWFLDIAAGVTIYGVSSGSSLDVRIAQSGT